jgi:transglutaminase-like putative cysteine protease
MAARAGQQGGTIENLQRRIVTIWRAIFAPGDWMALLAAIGLLLIPALTLAVTGWNLSLQTLVPVSVLSILFGFLLARSQYNEFFALAAGALYGFAFVILIASFNQPDGFAAGLGEVLGRFVQWVIDAFTGGVNQDDLVFTLLVSSLFWFLGYNTAWHVFRIDRVWRAILPPGLILLANAIYYIGGVRLTEYLVGFIFFALVLLVRSHLESRHWDWYVAGIRTPRRLRGQFLRVGVLLALATLLLAIFVPVGDVQERLTEFQEFLQGEPSRQLADAWSRLFSPGDLQGPTTTDYYGGDSLQLSGAIRLGDQVVMLIDVERDPTRRYYWRSRVFDTYTAGNWSSAATTRLTDPDAPLDIAQEAYFEGARVPVQQTYTIALNASRLVYTAPQPRTVNLATRTDLRYGETGTLQGSMLVSVIRPYRALYRGDQYTVTSLMSNATAEQLRGVAPDYPQEIADLYLPVPFSVTPRTLTLAEQIVAEAGAVTPYDRAKAVERWLRQNITYNETIPTPPIGQDPVDWVLFDYREGYCNYYASAMIVMLRHLGIPARMAAGFTEGEWDETEQAFVVEERDAHTWVEVYFPGYGWIEFEPTAAQQELNRGDETVNQPEPTQNAPTPTPTPSPTPTPTHTPTPGSPEETPQEQTQATSTAAPTLAPTMTATPVVVPTPPPPLRPPPRDPLGFLLSALSRAFLVLLAVALLILIALFIFWYWEWRGMRGMNPVVRAYARLERYLPLIGIRLAAAQTPDERRERIIRELPAAEPPVTAITRLYTTEKYAPPAPRGSEEARDDIADRAWSDARGTILQRWLRRLLRLHDRRK